MSIHKPREKPSIPRPDYEPKGQTGKLFKDCRDTTLLREIPQIRQELAKEPRARFISIARFCKIFEIKDPDTVRKEIAIGKIPGATKIRGQWRIPFAGIIEYCEKNSPKNEEGSGQ